MIEYSESNQTPTETSSETILTKFYSIDDLVKSKESTMVDKLKTIRPFAELDLLNLHENAYLIDNNDFIDKFIEVSL